ncbi:MAG: hypothetical protein ABIQ97_00685, partial [Lysobacteraceae bacterium]
DANHAFISATVTPAARLDRNGKVLLVWEMPDDTAAVGPPVPADLAARRAAAGAAALKAEAEAAKAAAAKAAAPLSTSTPSPAKSSSTRSPQASAPTTRARKPPEPRR